MEAFQSTRPVWGATGLYLQHHGRSLVSIHAPRVGRDHHRTRPAFGGQVSIHAPRVGRDLAHELGHMQMHRFNPRAPCGARPALHFAVKSGGRVSIHAPRVGRDHGKYDAAFDCTVSIHAPRVGRDPCVSWYGVPRSSFNPRAPCGARHQQRADSYYTKWFQSTRPVWGATATGVTTSPFCHVFMGIPLHKYDFLGT